MPMMPGDAAPWFEAPVLAGNPRYSFHTVAGRPVLLLFCASAGDPGSRAALATIARHRALFDDHGACFFGITGDPADAAQGRIAQQLPGIRWVLDFDGAVARAFGAVVDGDRRCMPQWIVLDAMLRVASVHPIERGEAAVASLQAIGASPAEPDWAPVLQLPRVLDPALCRRLIAFYEARGGVESGFMRDEGGMTVARTDHRHKRRADCHVDDAALLALLKQRLFQALRPALTRAFQFEATRVERWLVACYDGKDGGHFRPHRDNTTRGTAHRRFAVTINLNADDYDGGDLRFPEFGPRRYRAPTGGAVIFSCSLLHEAMPVTRGRRYAFLPFLYDDAAAGLRERNLAYVGPELQGYRSDQRRTA